MTLLPHSLGCSLVLRKLYLYSINHHLTERQRKGLRRERERERGRVLHTSCVEEDDEEKEGPHVLVDVQHVNDLVSHALPQIPR